MLEESFAVLVLSELSGGSRLPHACLPSTYPIPPPPPPPPSPALHTFADKSSGATEEKKHLPSLSSSPSLLRPIRGLPRMRRLWPFLESSSDSNLTYPGQTPVFEEEASTPWYEALSQALKKVTLRSFDAASSSSRVLLGAEDAFKKSGSIIERRSLRPLSIIAPRSSEVKEAATPAVPCVTLPCDGQPPGECNIEIIRPALHTLFLAADTPSPSKNSSLEDEEYPEEYYSNDEDEYYAEDEDGSSCSDNLDGLDEYDDESSRFIHAELLKNIQDKDGVKCANARPQAGNSPLLEAIEEQDSEVHPRARDTDEECDDGNSDKENVWVDSDSDRSNKENHAPYPESDSEDKENDDGRADSNKENDGC